MKKEKKKISTLEKLIIFMLVLIINLYAVPCYLGAATNGDIKNLPSNIFLVIIYYIIWVIKNFYYIIFTIIFIYITFKILIKSIEDYVERTYYIEKTDESDIKDDSYYRDMIVNHSPAVISYIDDFKLDIKDVVATLMSLELKGKIKIRKHIEIINKDNKNLSLNESYVLDNINKNNILEIKMDEFKTMVINDCLNSKLLFEKNFASKILIRSLIYFTSWIWCLNLLDYIPKNGTFTNILTPWLMLYIILSPFYHIISTYSYIKMSSDDPFVRNKKSKLINKKINGLKRFVSDFSKLDEKEYKHINLWEDYLIYSIITGDNKKIINQISKFIKIQL